MTRGHAVEAGLVIDASLAAVDDGADRGLPPHPDVAGGLGDRDGVLANPADNSLTLIVLDMSRVRSAGARHATETTEDRRASTADLSGVDRS